MKLDLLGGRQLDLSSPLVMGVLNVTPDSFSDGGAFLAPAAAIAQGRALRAAVAQARADADAWVSACVATSARFAPAARPPMSTR